MSTSIAVTQAQQLATTFGVTGDPKELVQTLKATAFKGANVTDEQFSALMIVANQYGLNPFTKEIYAFPDKGGIVPIVGVDGWARILNSHKQFDGMEFEQDNESCTCKIYRKDRNHPTVITEYMSECKRNAGPWNSHPKRMLRHKAMIQCARMAFGFGGIFDEDEGQRIIEGEKNITAQADVINGDNANPEREQLIKDAEAIANCGDVDALRAHFKSLEKDQRIAIGQAEMTRLGELAASVANMADADVIEHEEEVPL